ncbi:hypothetical protein [Streptomyces sp. R41]|uniref:Uncharacterized protein n=1 Tax=Streptomyces sp. R41 TaxID=3238632 RepID=A0AB39RTY5_9ACTN
MGPALLVGDELGTGLDIAAGILKELHRGVARHGLMIASTNSEREKPEL